MAFSVEPLTKALSRMAYQDSLPPARQQKGSIQAEAQRAHRLCMPVLCADGGCLLRRAAASCRCAAQAGVGSGVPWHLCTVWSAWH